MSKIRALGEHIRPICDRFWLFSIAGMSLGIIGLVAGSIVIGGKMPTGAGELFSAMFTGLLLVVQKVIEAQQTRRTMEQMHQSAPAAADGQSVDTMKVDADSVQVTRK